MYSVSEQCGDNQWDSNETPEFGQSYREEENLELKQWLRKQSSVLWRSLLFCRCWSMKRLLRIIVVHENHDKTFNTVQRNRETEAIKFTSATSRMDINRDEFTTVSDPNEVELQLHITIACMFLFWTSIAVFLLGASKSHQKEFTRFTLNARAASNSNRRLARLSFANPKRVGRFQLFDDALTEFSSECVNTVAETDDVEKNEIQIMWVAPPAGSGCVALSAMAFENGDSWFADDGQLTKIICEGAPERENVDDQCCACDEAKYNVRSSYSHCFPSSSHLLLLISHSIFSVCFRRNLVKWNASTRLSVCHLVDTFFGCDWGIARRQFFLLGRKSYRHRWFSFDGRMGLGARPGIRVTRKRTTFADIDQSCRSLVSKREYQYISEFPRRSQAPQTVVDIDVWSVARLGGGRQRFEFVSGRLHVDGFDRHWLISMGRWHWQRHHLYVTEFGNVPTWAHVPHHDHVPGGSTPTILQSKIARNDAIGSSVHSQNENHPAKLRRQFLAITSAGCIREYRRRSRSTCVLWRLQATSCGSILNFGFLSLFVSWLCCNGVQRMDSMFGELWQRNSYAKPKLYRWITFQIRLMQSTIDQQRDVRCQHCRMQVSSHSIVTRQYSRKIRNR